MNKPSDAPVHVRGPQNAPVTLSEFADFECPYCGAAYPIVKRLESTFGDRMRFAFYQFPLRIIHPHAELAAEAAEAAGAQGFFWEMHDTLFEHQDALDPPDILRYAAAIDVPDLRRFEHDLETHVYAPLLDQSIALAEAAGVQGTPAFFVNGEQYEGDYTYSALAALISRIAPVSGPGAGLSELGARRRVTHVDDEVARGKGTERNRDERP
jgi:Na+:H+ antiporter, NhaA family